MVFILTVLGALFVLAMYGLFYAARNFGRYLGFAHLNEDEVARVVPRNSANPFQ